MSEEIITALSNLGAISEEKAVDKELLKNTDRLRGAEIDENIKKLTLDGYVKETSGKKLYLTRIGLFRALSKFS